jgi:Dolichyl-phosphate-mannose-protein mannosyltransferase
VSTLRRRLQERASFQLTAVVLGGALFNGLLAIPIKRPRIFGDELIYWQLSRSIAWAGDFTLRGKAAPRYGVVYPALLAVAQRIEGSQTSAYAIAKGLNVVIFSLTAIPAYLIAVRVLRRRYALLAALLAVVLPSSIYTSTIMTENAFYPLFLTSAWLMLRALERPSTARQLLVAAAAAATFLVRSQAVVLLPAYLLAAIVLALVTSRGRRASALVACLRQQAPTIALLAVAGVAAAVVRGSSTLGPYHVLVTSFGPRPLVHWGLANLADLELYLGVIPLAAFGVLLVQALSSASLSPELRRHVVLTACLGAGLLATVAALSASKYGLGRTHERNLFYVVPLILICFFAWLDAGLPRPRDTRTAVALALVLLPLSIPAAAVGMSGEDGIALLLWEDMKIRQTVAIDGMVLVAAVLVAVFLRARRPVIPLAVCLVALAATTGAGESHAVDSLTFHRDEWRDFGWIDRAVGPNARVVALWATTKTTYSGIEGLWADEFFNRSVRDVASANGPLPDGLPVDDMTIHPNGCLEAALPWRPQYAVVEKEHPLMAPVVRVSPSKRAILYRLDAGASDRRCFARLRQH